MKRITRLGVAAVILFALIQLVPYGRDHENPAVIAEPAWDSPQTRELFFRACKDCHSYETNWPWYASIAPISWMMQYDIEEGRSHFNVSRWGQGKQDADEAAGMLRKGEMPPWFYLPAHPEAQLTDAEKQALIAGFVATFGDEQE
jgi:mono/diheme cytochrome c family protein